MQDTSRDPRSRRRTWARAADAPIPSVSVRVCPGGSCAVTTRRVLVWDEDPRHALDWGSELASSGAAATGGRGTGSSSDFPPE